MWRGSVVFGGFPLFVLLVDDCVSWGGKEGREDGRIVRALFVSGSPRPDGVTCDEGKGLSAGNPSSESVTSPVYQFRKYPNQIVAVGENDICRDLA